MKNVSLYKGLIKLAGYRDIGNPLDKAMMGVEAYPLNNYGTGIDIQDDKYQKDVKDALKKNPKLAELINRAAGSEAAALTHLDPGFYSDKPNNPDFWKNVLKGTSTGAGLGGIISGVPSYIEKDKHSLRNGLLGALGGALTGGIVSGLAQDETPEQKAYAKWENAHKVLKELGEKQVSTRNVPMSEEALLKNERDMARLVNKYQNLAEKITGIKGSDLVRAKIPYKYIVDSLKQYGLKEKDINNFKDGPSSRAALNNAAWNTAFAS